MCWIKLAASLSVIQCKTSIVWYRIIIFKPTKNPPPNLFHFKNINPINLLIFWIITWCGQYLAVLIRITQQVGPYLKTVSNPWQRYTQRPLRKHEHLTQQTQQCSLLNHQCKRPVECGWAKQPQNCSAVGQTLASGWETTIRAVHSATRQQRCSTLQSLSITICLPLPPLSWCLIGLLT